MASLHRTSSLSLSVDKDAVVAVDGGDFKSVLRRDRGSIVGDQGEGDAVDDEHGLVVAGGERHGGERVHDNDDDDTETKRTGMTRKGGSKVVVCIRYVGDIPTNNVGNK